MACIAVGSFHLAIKQLGLLPIDTEDLVAISQVSTVKIVRFESVLAQVLRIKTNSKLGKPSCFQTWMMTLVYSNFPFAWVLDNSSFAFLIPQCHCTARDLERMAEIIEGKLGVQMSTSPVSGLVFIRLFYFIFRNAARELGLSDFYDSAIILSDLEQKMEILACDASCASIRASELALVMLCTQMDASVSKLEAGAQQIHGLVDYAIQLQKLCRVSLNLKFALIQS
jgi:hypothetical protein